MTWNGYRTRGEILRDVSAVADAHEDGALPMHVAGVRTAFAGELDLEQAVIAAWRDTAAELPGIRAIVDRHREDPLDDAIAEAMSVATDKEHAWLAVNAGRAGIAALGAAHVGAQIEQQARAHRRVVRTPRRARGADPDWPAQGSPRRLIRTLQI